MQGFDGETLGKRPLGRTRCRWEDNINMDLHEVGCGAMYWIVLAEGKDRWRALVNAVMSLQGPFVDLLRTGQLLKKDSAPWSK